MNNSNGYWPTYGEATAMRRTGTNETQKIEQEILSKIDSPLTEDRENAKRVALEMATLKETAFSALNEICHFIEEGGELFCKKNNLTVKFFTWEKTPGFCLTIVSEGGLTWEFLSIEKCKDFFNALV